MPPLYIEVEKEAILVTFPINLLDSALHDGPQEVEAS